MKKMATLTLMLLSAVQGMETTTTTTIPSPPSNSKKEPGKVLNSPSFEQTSRDFNTYQAHAHQS